MASRGAQLTYEKLGEGGYVGSLGDRLTAYLRDNPTLSPTEIMEMYDEGWNGYWINYNPAPDPPPGNSILHTGHNLKVGTHYVVWS